MNSRIIILTLVFLLIYTIGNVSADMESSDIEMYYKDGTQYKVNLTDENHQNKTISINLNGKNYEKVTNESGIAELNINLVPGEYEVNSEYMNLTTTNIIKIKEVNTTLEYENNPNMIYKNGKFEVCLKGGFNKPLANKNIEFSICNKTYTKLTDENGIAKLNINLNPGSYEISAKYNGELYYSETKITTTINVFKSNEFNTKLIANDFTGEYQNSKYSIILTDLNNNPLKDEIITFTINGVSYKRTTNNNGVASLNINLEPNIYNIKINSIENHIIKINPISYNITSNDMNITYNDDSYYYISLFKNNTELSNKNIITEIYESDRLIKTINTVTYDNGLAKFKIDENTGNYLFKSYCNEYNYDKIYTESIVQVSKTNLTIQSQDYLLNRNEYFTIIAKANNKLIPNLEVNFTINNKTYLKTTNDKGEAKLKINLNNGDYLINYNINNINYNKINNSNTIEIKDIKLNTSIEILNNEINEKGDYLIAKLYDSNNILLKNQIIIFNINGINYERITNNEGIAKIKINLNNGKYPININYNGDSLFNKNQNSQILTVDKDPNFQYTFNLTAKIPYDAENIPVYRYIEMEQNNNHYKFVTQIPEDDEIQIEENIKYFLSFETNQLSIEENIQEQGLSLILENNEIFISYYGHLTNLTQFSIIFNENDEFLYGSEAQIVVNGKLKARLFFSTIYYTIEISDYLTELGFDLSFPTENIFTSLKTEETTHNKTIQLSPTFKTVESYAITSSKISNIDKILESYYNFDNSYDINGLEYYIISLNTILSSQELDDVLARKYNCTWSEKQVIVLTTSEWSGTTIHSTYDTQVEGNNSWEFKVMHGILFSLCEKLALEMAGIDATSAVSQIMEGVVKGEVCIIDQKDGLITIKLENSESEIIINQSSGNTLTLLDTGIDNILKNFKYKGGMGNMVLSYAYPKDFSSSMNLFNDAINNDVSHIFSHTNLNNIKRGVFNEIRLHHNDIGTKLSSAVVFFLPKIGTAITASVGVMIEIGEKSVQIRNKYASDETYQYFSYHPPVWEAKTIQFRNNETGYLDSVEIPYNADGTYNMKKAIYIDGKNGKRNLTAEEEEIYGKY